MFFFLLFVCGRLYLRPLYFRYSSERSFSANERNGARSHQNGTICAYLDRNETHTKDLCQCCRPTCSQCVCLVIIAMVKRCNAFNRRPFAKFARTWKKSPRSPCVYSKIQLRPDWKFHSYNFQCFNVKFAENEPGLFISLMNTNNGFQHFASRLSIRSKCAH